MGTKGSYTGGGGKAGEAVREGLQEWLDSLPGGGGGPSGSPTGPAPDSVPSLAPQLVLPAIGLFAPSTGAAASSRSTRSGSRARARTNDDRTRAAGAQRSTTRSASTAGRGAAAAYAFGTGNAGALRELGLDYDTLTSLGDPLEVSRRIVSAVCGPLPDGTIEDDEQRYVVSGIAQWVLEALAVGQGPSPDEIVREAIARIIFEAVCTETAAKLSRAEVPIWASTEAERQFRDTADALARQAELSPTGATPSEFVSAIEEGMEALRTIWQED